jgi:recombinational DNA repair protein (RecF pathway)
LVSTRLLTHYGSIVNHIDRVQLGYELIKQLDKATEDVSDAEYFELLQQAFEALHDTSVELELIKVWFAAQLLRFGGLAPNLASDSSGNKLAASEAYEFDFDEAAFRQHSGGTYSANSIKFLRLLFSANTPATLAKISNADQFVNRAGQLVLSWQQRTQ